MRFFFLALTAAVGLYAQNAQVSGLVRDPSGSSIPNARIAISNQATSSQRKTSSNDSGLYTIPLLPPGTYTMVVEANGFQTQKREGITLEVGQNARIDFKLQVGATEQTVTVQGDASMINSTDGNRFSVDTSTFYLDLSLSNGRADSICAPLYLVAHGLHSDLGTIEIDNADNRVRGDGALWDMSDALDSGILRGFSISMPRTLSFQVKNPAVPETTSFPVVSGFRVFGNTGTACSSAR